MFGCLRKVGCLIILVVAAVAGYYWFTHHYRASRSDTPSARTWRPVTAADGEQGKQAVSQLQGKSGKVYVNLTASEAVGYLVQSLAHQLPASAEGVQAMIAGDTLRVRAVLPLKDLGGAEALGPLASLLSGRDTVELAGTTDLVRPGLAQLRVVGVRVRSLDIPGPAIPRLIQQLRRETPEGLAPNGLPLPLPPNVGDIRIGNGKVTLYKNV